VRAACADAAAHPHAAGCAVAHQPTKTAWFTLCRVSERSSCVSQCPDRQLPGLIHTFKEWVYPADDSGYYSTSCCSAMRLTARPTKQSESTAAGSMTVSIATVCPTQAQALHRAHTVHSVHNPDYQPRLPTPQGSIQPLQGRQTGHELLLVLTAKVLTGYLQTCQQGQGRQLVQHGWCDTRGLMLWSRRTIQRKAAQASQLCYS
jgi:hypothetical protein